MFLKDLQEAIDDGKTAKLSVVPERPSELRFTIRIKRVESYYLWQNAISNINAPEVVLSPPQTDAFPSWETLLTGIEGQQTETSGWMLTDEPLLDYLPTRRNLYGRLRPGAQIQPREDQERL